MANNLKGERTRLEMSQEEIATALNVNKKTYRGWEQDIGTCPGSKLLEMSNTFGCSIDYLFGLTNDRRRRK